MDGESRFTNEVSPYFSRFKKDHTDEMELFFPNILRKILWTMCKASDFESN